MGLIFVDIIFNAKFKYLFFTHLGARTVSQRFLEKYPRSAILISNLDSTYLNCIRKDEISCLNQ